MRTQDRAVWFEDGNIILVGQNVEFRVYKGPLIKHSPVFRDMLSLLQPVSDTSHLPVVHVTDHPKDIRRLLAGFIFGNESDMRCSPTVFTTSDPGFAVVSSIIRMGHKYEIDAAVKAGVRFLTSHYPMEYADWRNALEGPPSFSAVESIGVVNLARLTDTPEVLPAAFYKVATLDIISGFTRDDGVVEELSRTDLARVLIARGELIKSNAYNAAYILLPSPRCLTRTKCKARFDNLCAGPTERTLGPDWNEGWMSYAYNLKRVDMWPCGNCAIDIGCKEGECLKAMWAGWPETLGIKDEGFQDDSASRWPSD